MFISGLLHSGTTWMAALFETLKFDLGHPLLNESARQGREWLPLHRLILDAVNEMGACSASIRPYWWRTDPARHEPIRSVVGAQLAALDWPQVVKLPGAYVGWFWENIQPGYVVLVTRDPQRWAASVESNKFMRDGIPLADRPAQYREAIEELRQSLKDWPHVEVDFETAVRDPVYAYACLEDVLGVPYEDFVAAHTEVTRPDWVGYNARLMGVERS